MDFQLKDAGKFRANENASQYNTIAIVDATPGTPQTDTVTIDTAAFTGGEVISGVTYAGKAGQAEVIEFGNQQRPDAQRIKFSITLPALTASFDTKELRDAINEVIQRQEVNPVVKVTYDDVGDELVVVHSGSGTLSKLIIDGAPVGTAARTSISVVQTQDVQALRTERDKKVGQGRRAKVTKKKPTVKAAEK